VTHVPTYDIFCGIPDQYAIWKDAVAGLGAANDRMKSLAEKSPGPYFIFDPSIHRIVARTDNSVERSSARNEKKHHII
jgi:hypothetical protein